MGFLYFFVRGQKKKKSFKKKIKKEEEERLWIYPPSRSPCQLDLSVVESVFISTDFVLCSVSKGGKIFY